MNKKNILSSEERINYINLINKIISRMNNNHFKWYIIHLSLLSFIIPIFLSIYELINKQDLIVKIIISIIGFFSFNLISFISFYNSWSYLNIERSFINMQNIVREQWIEPSLNWNDYKDKKKKYGFVFVTEVIIWELILSITIFFPIMFFCY